MRHRVRDHRLRWACCLTLCACQANLQVTLVLGEIAVGNELDGGLRAVPTQQPTDRFVAYAEARPASYTSDQELIFQELDEQRLGRVRWDVPRLFDVQVGPRVIRVEDDEASHPGCIHPAEEGRFCDPAGWFGSRTIEAPEPGVLYELELPVVPRCDCN